jgi:hypothetical protein
VAIQMNTKREKRRTTCRIDRQPRAPPHTVRCLQTACERRSVLTGKSRSLKSVSALVIHTAELINSANFNSSDHSMHCSASEDSEDCRRMRRAALAGRNREPSWETFTRTQ